jgi:hypothetical protein
VPGQPKIERVSSVSMCVAFRDHRDDGQRDRAIEALAHLWDHPGQVVVTMPSWLVSAPRWGVVMFM